MGDRLTELFASKPTSYLGLGVVYNGDTRGNGVTSNEQGIEIIQRLGQSDGGVSARGGLVLYKVDGNWLVKPSTVLGAMPTIGGTPLDDDPAPELTVSGSGTRYAVLNISGTPSTTTLDGRDFFHPTMSSIAVTITETGTAPVAGDLLDASGSFKALLATFQDGVKTAQNYIGPLTGYVQDQLDGSGEGLLVLY